MTSMKVAINGFGRIGKSFLRAYVESILSGSSWPFEIVLVNSNQLTANQAAHLLKYDSTHGPFSGSVIAQDNSLVINDKIKIEIQSENDLNKLDWQHNNIDLVAECTGRFNTLEEAAKHIQIANAKKVLVSAPCTNADVTFVYGVTPIAELANKSVISIGSCTTNCLAPVLKVLQELCGVECGFMTTIHAYTNDQEILDARHKDWRRGRSGAVSIIPTSTGAATSIGDVLPELKGKIHGAALRVPVPNVSLVDLSFVPTKTITAEQIAKSMQEYSKHYPRVMMVSNEQLVSVDFNHTVYSAVFDTTQTHVVTDRLCRVVAWYDNEWGFVNRMLDTCGLLALQS